MPKKLERCVSKVQAGGKSKSSAWAICQHSVMGKGGKSSPSSKKGGK